MVAVSTLTLAELAGGPHGAEHDPTRARREHQLRYVWTKVEPLDVMIAATALAHDLPLYTKKAKDLRGLEQLIEIVDVGA